MWRITSLRGSDYMAEGSTGFDGSVADDVNLLLLLDVIYAFLGEMILGLQKSEVDDVRLLCSGQYMMRNHYAYFFSNLFFL